MATPKPKPLKERIETMTDEELADLVDQYPSMSAGNQDELMDAVDARLAEFSNQTF